MGSEGSAPTPLWSSWVAGRQGSSAVGAGLQYEADHAFVNVCLPRRQILQDLVVGVFLGFAAVRLEQDGNLDFPGGDEVLGGALEGAFVRREVDRHLRSVRVADDVVALAGLLANALLVGVSFVGGKAIDVVVVLLQFEDGIVEAALLLVLLFQRR